MLKAVAFQTVCAWVLAVLVYQIGSRIETGVINMANVLVGGIILLIVLVIIIRQFGKKETECASCPYCDSCKK